MKKTFLAKIFAFIFILVTPFIRGMQVVEGGAGESVTEEEKALLEKIEKKVKSATLDLTRGLMTQTLFDIKMAEIETSLKGLKESTVITEMKTAMPILSI